jgi:hypothetical protein
MVVVVTMTFGNRCIVVTVTFGSIDVVAINSGMVIMDHCMVVFKRGVVDVAFGNRGRVVLVVVTINRGMVTLGNRCVVMVLKSGVVVVIKGAATISNGGIMVLAWQLLAMGLWSVEG